LLAQGLLPGQGHALLSAFLKSLLMNTIFAFPMMTFHRLTDMLIDRQQLFSAWPVSELLSKMDWPGLVRVAGASCLWFWVPAHTVTFLLPQEYRVLSAALLAIALGLILGYAKKRAAATTVPSPA